MKIALELARRGLGKTNPNPLVGAVLVKNGKILAKGYHKRAGLPHAEIEALRKAKDCARGSTLYVNLEPCSHFGRTPPCVDYIIEEGIEKVVIGMRDPNPINNGKGIERLRRAGISVKEGVLKDESYEINRPFNVYITRRRPYVILKMAQTLDGKIATSSGDSKWITNESSRSFAHKLRNRADAVLVGINTVIKDNPFLDARNADATKCIIKVILDSALKTPTNSRIFKDRSSKVIIATSKNVSKKGISRFRRTDADIVRFGSRDGMIDLKELVGYLADIGIMCLLVEGGGTIAASFLNHGLVDEIFFFISPKIVGGRDAVTSVEGKGIEALSNAIRLDNIALKRFNEDLLIRGYVCRNS